MEKKSVSYNTGSNFSKLKVFSFLKILCFFFLAPAQFPKLIIYRKQETFWIKKALESRDAPEDFSTIYKNSE